MQSSEFFFSLTPERVLRAVESLGFRCTGRCLALNSLENRVYEVEIEAPAASPIRSRWELFRVIKFYRPGRWSREQILEEHTFLQDLSSKDFPVVMPIPDQGGNTLFTESESSILYAVYPKVGGRLDDELSLEKLEQLGRLIARMHMVGASRPCDHRMRLTTSTYGISNLEYLLGAGIVPPGVLPHYERLVRSICDISEQLLSNIPVQRIHGDLHVGNILWNEQGPFVFDFDDMLRGPCVQDMWLLPGSRGTQQRERLEAFLLGYEQLRSFDRSSLAAIEALRSLRYVHYTAWVARRWEDPIFPRTFPHFGSNQYWRDQLSDLQEQLQILTVGED